MNFDKQIGVVLSNFLAAIVRDVTTQRTADVMAEAAMGLRKRFPIPVLKAARYVLDLAIDGEMNVNKYSQGQTKKETKDQSGTVD